MKQITFLLATGIFIMSANSIVAGEDPEIVVEKKYVIALSTDDFELEGTDLSHLAVGDAETILTESGKTVDLLRTEEGIEIYIDVEVLHEGHETAHKVIKIKHGEPGDDMGELHSEAVYLDQLLQLMDSCKTVAMETQRKYGI